MGTSVLLAFPQADQRTGLYIKKAFEQLGCRLIIVDPKIEPGACVPRMTQFGPNGPDMFLCSRTPALAPIVANLKRRYPSTKFACWNTDGRKSITEFGNELMKLFGLMDIMYSVPEGNIQEYVEKAKCKDVKWLPQAMDPDFFNKIPITKEDHEKYDCDVMFAGDVNWAMHTDRKAWIKKIRQSGVNIKVYGPSTNNYIKNHEFSKAARCAKISLGRSALVNIATSISVRDYQIMGAGGFLLTNNVKDLHHLFELNRECVIYMNDDDCVDKIHYYLHHEDERKKIQETGFKAAHEKHTYKVRVQQILDDLVVMRGAK